MDIQEIEDRIVALKARLGDLQRYAESGAEWAEICRIEDEELTPLEDEREEWLEANSQFGRRHRQAEGRS